VKETSKPGTGIGKPIAMNLMEKRRYPRFRAAENALAAVGEEPFTLKDLSAGGFGVRYYGEQPLPEEVHMDLFFLDREFGLYGVRCRKVFEKMKVSGKAGGIPEWHVGLQILDPTTTVMKELHQFCWTRSDPGEKDRSGP
jgi:hypothetical protein